MSDGEYSQKEENTFRQALTDRLNNQDVMLNKIYEQTLKTNGRVNKLENWRSFTNGGLAIISAVLLPLVFIVIEILTKK